MKSLRGDTLPSKEAAALYGYGDNKDSCPSFTAPYTLNRIIASRRSLSAVRSAFGVDVDALQPKRTVSISLPIPKTVSFEFPEKKSVSFASSLEPDYGYGECFPEPPNKRRRFERRNSKTPQMLMQMKASIGDFDFARLDAEVEAEEQAREHAESSKAVNVWDTGLQVAEELVMHLQSRRMKRLSLHSSHPGES